MRQPAARPVPGSRVYLNVYTNCVSPVRLQDPFGNYVVQYVLELGDASASGAVMRGLAGHWPNLAQQKFSSNVVEKCLKLPGLAATQVRNNSTVPV